MNFASPFVYIFVVSEQVDRSQPVPAYGQQTIPERDVVTSRDPI